MKNLIISAIGSDNPGIVSKLSGIINSHGGNIEESRMTILGADFVVIMLVSLEDKWTESLLVTLQSIKELVINTKNTASKTLMKGDRCNIELSGADNEGIINVLANYLAEKSMNIHDMDTYVSNAPVTGTPLFNLKAIIESVPEIRTVIAILGAVGLFGFAILQIRSVTKQKFSLETKSGQGPFVAGILLSALNPFFIIWWLTIGLVLISESIQNFGIIGIVILFLFHIWMDYAWLFTIATFSSSRKFSQ